MKDPNIDLLLLMPVFILNFLCIHPFNDGNGRMSRLLTLLILYRAGYIAGKYISLEKLIADSKESYYEALQDSDAGWHEGENDYLPFVRYMLGIIIAVYRGFTDRVQILITKGFSKTDRVREMIRNRTGKMTRKEIMAQCPDWIIDIGPEGGSGGGEVVFTGTPESITKCNVSKTGQYLKQLLCV